MATPARMSAQYITEELGGTWRNGKGTACCPVQAHRDRKPSLSITEADDGKPLVHCHAGCSQEAVIEALKARSLWPKGELPNSQIEATYDYTDETGKLLYQIVRKPGKKFFQRYPNGAGDYVWKKHPRQVLYRLPEVRKAKRVFVVEGEKDADTLCKRRFVATTNAGGAKAHWLPAFTEALQGKDQVVLVPDNDSPGWERVLRIARELLQSGGIGRITVRPPAHGAKDVTEWCDAHPDEKLLLGKAIPMIELADVAELEERLLAEGVLVSTNSVDRVDEGWPKPEPLANELPPVETFDPELLPVSFRDLAEDIAERMQVPLDCVAIPLVVSLAGAVNRRATIQPKANDTGWVVVPNLWGGLIMPPGFMKSPVIQAATQPLNQIQTAWRMEHQEALEVYALEKEEFELQKSAWKEQYKARTKKGEAAPDRPEDAPEAPKLRRLIVNDATFESLHEMMADNPAGLLIIRDEGAS